MNNTIQLYIDDEKEIKGYPITSPDRVVDEKGKSVQQEIKNINGQLDTKANEDDLIVERNRITNLATLQQGSTTGDAELKDGRVGNDGVTYANIGTAIRTQVSIINNNINNINNKMIDELILPDKFNKLPFKIYKGIDGKYYTTYKKIEEKEYTNVYLDPINGNNAWKGDTSQLPMKTIQTLLNSWSSIDNLVINIIGDCVFEGQTITDLTIENKNIKFKPCSNNKVVFARKYPQSLAKAWVLYSGDTVYKSEITYSASGFVDVNRRDENDVIIPYKRVDTLDECIAEKYTWFQSSSSKHMYVNTDTIPDNDKMFINYDDVEYTLTLNSNSTVEFENIDFIIQGNGTSILSATGDNTGILLLDNCRLSGGSYLNTTKADNGCLKIKNVRTLLENTICAYTLGDGFQYFSGAITDIQNNFYIELYCKAYNCGKVNKWSNNATTAHNYSNILRIGFEAYNCGSPMIADVGSCKSVLIDCTAKDSYYQDALARYGFVFCGLKANDYGYVWLRNCKAGGDLSHGLILGYENQPVYGFVDNFQNYKKQTVTTGSYIDTWI